MTATVPTRDPAVEAVLALHRAAEALAGAVYEARGAELRTLHAQYVAAVDAADDAYFALTPAQRAAYGAALGDGAGDAAVRS